jgi:CelD/BcsL family acetyltransferase involved in cellulose biosynthesis
LRIDRIPSRDWQEPFLSEWSRLLDDASVPSIFLSPDWMVPWQRHFGGDHEAFVIAGRDQSGGLVALAPLYRRRLGPAWLPGVRVLAFLGDEGAGSEYLGILARRGAEREFVGLLERVLEGEWALADLRGLRDGQPCTDLLIAGLGSKAPGRVHRERHPCATIHLPRDYEAYLGGLPAKFRTTVRYRTNKLLKNFSVKMLRTSRSADLDAHLERLFEMHQDRWEAERHPGSFYHPRKRAFYRDVAAAFLGRGWLRFYHLEVDGVIRAAQFGFAFGSVLHSLQEAFDHRFRPQGVGGIGVVLRGMVIKECIAEGLVAYDFLGGTEEFKTRWGTTTHEVERVRIGAPGPVGGLAYLCTAGWRDAKLWIRASLPKRLVEARDRWRVRRQARKARRLAAAPEKSPR